MLECKAGGYMGDVCRLTNEPCAWYAQFKESDSWDGSEAHKALKKVQNPLRGNPFEGCLLKNEIITKLVEANQ